MSIPEIGKPMTKQRRSSAIRVSLSYVVLVFFVVVAVFPVMQIFTISLRPADRLLSTSLEVIPKNASFNNYIALFTERPFLLWLLNSTFVALVVTVTGVALASTCGYAFSRYNFIGKKFGLLSLLVTQMFPATMLLLPMYIMLVKLHLINTYRGLVIAYSVSSVPFSIWIMKGYYDTIPGSLEEAATIDGASRMYTLWRIILPLAAPALAVVFLFNFMSSWNDFLLARIMLQKPGMYTWPLGLQSLQAQFATEWGAYAAASLLLAVPVAALFLYTSKWLISGLTLGSVKGD